MKTQIFPKHGLVIMVLVVTAFSLFWPRSASAEQSPTPVPSPATSTPTATPSPSATAEPKSAESNAVNPEVQSEVEKKTAEKRAQLLKDAQSALEETNRAVEALDQGNKDEALAELEKVTGKLDLIVARDPKLALAPVGVATIIRDLYSNPDTVNATVKEAKKFLSEGRIQQARLVLGELASEAEIRVTNIPLATYPAAMKAVAPLIDAGENEKAKTALRMALNTLVVETYTFPLPKIRAEAMLGQAEKVAAKADRTEEENKKLKDLTESARHELQLGEALGYGDNRDYKPLYRQLDEILKKTEGGKSGKGIFDKIKNSLANLKNQKQSK